MLDFFDSLYYAVYLSYKRREDKGAEFSASCFVSGFQAFNILTVVLPIYSFISPEIYFTKWISGSVIIALIIINYFRYVYFDNRHSKIKEKWDVLPPEKLKKIVTLNWLFCTISVAIFIVSICFIFYNNPKH